MSLLIIQASMQGLTDQLSLSFAVSEDGQTLSQSGAAPITVLPKQGRNQQVILVLPPQALSWHLLKLPAIALNNRQKVRSVLQGMLEEQLLDDVDQMHFALAPNASSGALCQVVACQSAWLQSYVEILAKHGFAVQRIVPLFEPRVSTDQNENHTTPQLFAIGLETQPWLVLETGSNAGIMALPLTSSTHNLDLLLSLPKETEVIAEAPVYSIAQQFLGRPVRLAQLGQHVLRAASSSWNMAQFQFANTRRDKTRQTLLGIWHILWRSPTWRLVRWGFSLVLLAQLIGLNIWAWQARQHLQTQRAQMSAILLETFPATTTVIDAPVQMQREVQRLQQASGALTRNSFVALAADVGASLPEGQRISAISFENSNLKLRLTNLDEDTFVFWQQELALRGLSVQKDDATGQILLQRTVP